MPGAEVLGGQFGIAGEFVQPVVDFGRTHGVWLAYRIAIFEQPIAWNTLTLRNHAHNTRRKYRPMPDLAALARKVQLDLLAVQVDVLLRDRSQAAGMVFPQIAVIAHAQSGAIQQAHDR